jgi:cytochrome P450
VFPDFSGRPEIVIPNNKTRWLIDKPDHISSVGAAHYDQLQGDYAFTDPYIIQTLYHEHVVHKNLARRLHTIIPGVWEELQLRFDNTWGFDTTEWKDICVFENMMRTIAQASNRMFVGVPLCRDEDYLTNMSSFAQDVVTCVIAMPFIPKILAPLFGPLFSIPNRIHYKRVSRYTLPLIKQRLADIAEKDSNPDFKWEEPDDYITWHIRLAQSEGRTKELEPEMISKFLMPLSFAAIHTTTFTITNTLFDILGSDPSRGFLSGLREEAARVFAESDNVWTKAGLSRLVRADSAIRESMRVSNFLTRGVMRKVVAKEGLKNEEEGWTAPYGSYISVDVDSVHHDPAIYPNPYDYDAFRFSRPREEYEAKHPEDKNSVEGLRLKNTGMISTGDAFLPFGHGRHAWYGGRENPEIGLFANI